MPAPDAPGGRGLPLMHVLADEVVFQLSENGLCDPPRQNAPRRAGEITAGNL